MARTPDRLRILAFEGFYGASHWAFLDGLAERSRHEWRLLTLPARSWRRRMLSGAEELAGQAATPGTGFDLVFATDMLDLERLAALLPPELSGLPRVLYFHENQITYPARYPGREQWRFGLVNVRSALAADRVVFNSEFHRRAFLEALPDFIAALPSEARAPAGAAERIAARSAVVHPGIDAAGIAAPDRSGRAGPLRLVWNHRWEHDERPEAFFGALEALAARGTDFRAIVCGESFARRPAAFDRARQSLGARIEHLGYAPDRGAYLALLGRGDVAVSTAAQEFFGIAWLEACAAGCMPLLPRRLSYPELLPEELRAECLCADDGDLAARLERLAADPAPVRARAGLWRTIAQRYDWPRQAAAMDRLVEEAAGAGPGDGRASRFPETGCEQP